MRRTISMHVLEGGISTCQSFTLTETKRIIRDCMRDGLLVSSPASVAQAMRDIMDEQTVEFIFRTSVVRFEIDSIFA